MSRWIKTTLRCGYAGRWKRPSRRGCAPPPSLGVLDPHVRQVVGVIADQPGERFHVAAARALLDRPAERRHVVEAIRAADAAHAVRQLAQRNATTAAGTPQ